MDDTRLPARVVLTGGPGVGKTTLLRELAARGFHVVDESAREVIRERKAAGLPPRPDPASFAREILRRDEARHRAVPAHVAWAFFDRCALEAIGMLLGCGALAPAGADAEMARFSYHRRVFVLPPWREIYRQDDERDHDFDHCVRVHDEIVRWYTRCGHEVHEVPRLPPRERAGGRGARCAGRAGRMPVIHYDIDYVKYM